MLQNFEEQTYELTTDEVAVALEVGIFIEKNASISKPVTSTDICDYFNDPILYPKRKIKFTGSRVRKLVNYICKTYLPNLIGTNKGYYCCTDVEELKRAAKTLLSRANENQRRADVIFKHLSKTYGVRHGRH